MDRDRGRLLWALAASVLLHGWLLATDSPGARRASTAGGAALNVTLPAPAIDYAAPATDEPRVAALPRRESDAAVHAPRVVNPAVKPAAVTPAAEARAELNINGSTAHTQPSDPTYYAARSLDVYPKALTVLDLGVPRGSAKVRATLYIDESGSVNEVRAIEAANADIENAARDLLLRARFTPAAKDGRIVKAQVLVSLD